jgi:cation transport ATPase
VIDYYPKSRVNSVDGMMIDSTVIDYSFVTGEADPITKKSGDKVFAGGRQMGKLSKCTFCFTKLPDTTVE